MTVIVSTTNDDIYRFFIPLINWAWNKLGIRVICSYRPHSEKNAKWELISKTNGLVHKIFPEVLRPIMFMPFYCEDQKEATYSQVSRLFGGALGIDENEVILSSDVDMMVFRKNFIHQPIGEVFNVYGDDLVPEGQIPVCYVAAYKRAWTKYFSKGRTYQECLDDELGHENCEHMRGNLWARDQELLKKYIGNNSIDTPRARPGTQFASQRIDRDDAYFMDRLNPDIIDYHMHRPGFTDENFEKILSVISYFYPNDDLTWMREYQKEYKKLL